MATEVLRRRVQHEVHAELEWLLQIRAREGVVRDRERARAMRDLRERGDVENLEERVRRRLDPHELRLAADGPADRRGTPHVDGGERDAGAVEYPREEPVGPAVHVVPHDDVIALLEEVRDSVARGHARCERERPPCPFERGKTRFERGPRRVARPPVLEALVLADGDLREGGGLKDRDDDRAGRDLGFLARVDRERLESGFAASQPHHADE